MLKAGRPLVKAKPALSCNFVDQQQLKKILPLRHLDARKHKNALGADTKWMHYTFLGGRKGMSHHKVQRKLHRCFQQLARTP
eukprot:1040404-Amphidinium_carterae.1